MDYTREFAIHRTARVGVIVTRTREVRRATDLLLNYAHYGESGPKPVYMWDCLAGWKKIKYAPNGDGRVVVTWEADVNPDEAPGAFDAVEGFPADTIAIMTHPHELLEIPQVKQRLKNYCFDFQDARGLTLVLLVPEFTKIPIEIESDVTILDLDLPDTKTLNVAINEKIGRRRELQPSEIVSLAHAAAGMTQFEAERAYARTAAIHIETLATAPIGALVDSVLESKTELINKSETLKLYPKVSMEDVGGLLGLKQWLEFNRLKLDPANHALGADRLTGCLIAGVLGCGKSLSVKAIAWQYNLPLIRFDVGALFGGLVGESEAKTESAFKTLKAMGPCVVWIDEIDKAGLSPGAQGDSGASSRILQSLLFHMQEMKTGAFWGVTANDVEQIPIELMRPGRLDAKFFIGEPDSDAREAIARIHLRKRFQDANIELGAFAEATEGFIGSEIEQCVSDAVTHVLRHKVRLTESVLVQLAKATIPTGVSFKEKFDAMKKWGSQYARDASKEIIIGGSEIVSPPSARPTVKIPRRPALASDIIKR